MTSKISLSSKLKEHLPHGGKEGCDSCEVIEQRKNETKTYNLDIVSKDNNQFMRFPELRNMSPDAEKK